MNKQLDQIIQIMSQKHGFDLSHYDPSFLANSLAKRLIATSIHSGQAYQDLLLENKSEAETFFCSLNITYSEFFRNPLTFALLEELILPRLIEAKLKSGSKELRIWSAGCAAGQEPYSVAILLEDIAAERRCPLSFRIFATDISEAALLLAREGAYDSATVQNVRLKHLQSCFHSKGKAWIIAPSLRERVHFSSYDLLDERSSSPSASLYGDFDLILCSNLLFYYRQEKRQLIVDKVSHALSPGGFLVTGEAERDIVAMQDGLRAVVASAAIFEKTEFNPSKISTNDGCHK